MTDNVVYSRGNKQKNPGWSVCVKASTGAAMKMMLYKKQKRNKN